MRYTATTALTAIKAEVNWQTEPTLDTEQLLHCLTYAAVADASGRYPDEDDYEPTYTSLSMNAAYARAYRLKASKLSEAADMTDAAGNSKSPQLRREFLVGMAKDYEAKAVSVANMRTNPYTGRNSILDRVIVN